MNDKFNDDIRKRTEDLEIPDSLSTDNMMKKLRNYPGKGGVRKIIKIGSLMAAGILMAAGLTFAFSLENKENNTAPVQNVATAKSYNEIYSYFNKDIFESLGDLIDKGPEVNFDVSEDSAVDGSGDESSDGNSDIDYSSTNIQVEGVDEGDTVKTDGNYIYVIDNESGSIKIFSVEDELVKLVSTTSLPYSGAKEMYVKGKFLVVIASPDDYSYNGGTYILTYDIAERTNPLKIGEVRQDGYFTSSRMVNDILYTFTTYYMYEVTPDDCVPSVNGEQLEPEDVYLTCDIVSPNYQLITSVDINSPNSVIANKTILGEYSDFYVSNSFIYVASLNQNNTQIIKLSYENGNITDIATGDVEGYINNQFSMDEYNGNLRVVTSENSGVWLMDDIMVDSSVRSEEVETTQPTEQPGNNLYVLNGTLSIIGKLEGLAPGETIYSARFLGDMVYFVTYRTMDPLFAVDLSDPSNPKLLSELEITGFSDYLHFWSEDLLLGIGQETDPNTGASGGLKLSMFNISNPSNVTEFSKSVMSEYSSAFAGINHKTVLLDSEKGIIGVVADSTDLNYNYYGKYLLFTYDEETGFILRLSEDLNNGSNGGIYMDYYSDARGLFINEMFYIVNPTGKITVYSLADFSPVGVLEW